MRRLFKVGYRATDLTGKVREKDRVGSGCQGCRVREVSSEEE